MLGLNLQAFLAVQAMNALLVDLNAPALQQEIR